MARGGAMVSFISAIINGARGSQDILKEFVVTLQLSIVETV